MDYKKLLLNRLLDKFERSKSYLDAGVSRRVMLKLGSADYPEYDIENSTIREIVNAGVMELNKKGILGYEWLKYEQGNIIHRVWLKPERVEDAYQEAGRMAKRKKAEAVLDLVGKSGKKITTPWIKKFLKDAEAGIAEKKSTAPFLPDDPEAAGAILTALEGIDGINNEEFLERVFSLKCFGDSKYFERNVKKKIVRLIKKYLIEEDHDPGLLSEEEVLAQVGIVKAPELIEFAGPVQARLSGRTVNFAVFHHGIALNTYTVAELEITDLAAVEKVLFIENKANFLDYLTKRRAEDELVIFHGGFYSPAKGQFFQKIYDGAQKGRINFYHWGDIDLGGFRMFHRLRKNIIPKLKPYFMDKDALYAKKDYWISIDKKYRAELGKLLTMEEYALFHEVIREMLHCNCRLEQEAFLFS
jgi:hypothetical protein